MTYGALRQGERVLVETSLVAMICPLDGCGVIYGLGARFQEKRREDGKSWHCPNGHTLSYRNHIASVHEKLSAEQAKSIALRDQLEAANREAEAVRVATLRERQRIANGMCPCCNRPFEALARHMKTKHPDYPAPKVAPLKFKCSCWRKFDTFHALRVHQGKSRGDDWAKPGTSSYWAHLTVTP